MALFFSAVELVVKRIPLLLWRLVLLLKMTFSVGQKIDSIESHEWTWTQETWNSLTESVRLTKSLSNSCLLNLHAQGNTRLYNSNIQNRVLQNVVGCPAGERATHVSQNESFANLLRPSVSLQMGQWMCWKRGFPKTLLGENAGNGREKHMFLLMHKEGFSHANICQSSHVHMRDFQTAEIFTKRTAR